MFTLQEVTNWFGVTVFELIVFFSSLFIYTIFLSLKIDGWMDMNWWFVHAPLFLCDAFLAYFCVIVFIRMCLEGLFRSAFFKSLWRLNHVTLMCLVKILLCLKLEGDRRISQAEMWAPVFFYLLTLILRTCQLR